MTRGLQQQPPSQGWVFPKSCASPQHGQKPASRPIPAPEPRSYKPRPGH
ncbi:hypothetical protein [Phenylobacterium sp. SCN 70-31]|mgnify:CR=1 FL=1|nr:hypothetical protein [Phenylobacterium sp. SCN 70-31]